MKMLSTLLYSKRDFYCKVPFWGQGHMEHIQGHPACCILHVIRLASVDVNRVQGAHGVL